MEPRRAAHLSVVTIVSCRTNGEAMNQPRLATAPLPVAARARRSWTDLTARDVGCDTVQG
jgi:hypothetical protein